MFKIPNDFFLGLLFIPFLLEASGIPLFTFIIPGFPLTIGRLSLVLMAFTVISKQKYSARSTKFNLVIVLLVIGGFIGSFFAENLSTEISKFFGNALLFMAVIFTAPAIQSRFLKKVIDYFFIFIFVYWSLYIYSNTFLNGAFQTFGEIYRNNNMDDSSLLNYHSFGLIFSNSFLYLFFRYFFKKEKLDFVNILFILFSLVTIFITESRANFIITIAVLFLLLSVIFKLTFSKFLGSFLFIGVFLITFSSILSSNEVLTRRYSFFNDDAYLDQTIGARSSFIEVTFDHFIEYPFGRGFSNNRIPYAGTYYQPHNQYATFILMGGITAIFAILIWFKLILNQIVGIIRTKSLGYAHFLSIILITLLTLFTNDISGAFFFLTLMIQSWFFSKKNI